MGQLTKGHIFETIFWLGFAAFLYYFSFEFDQPIEIYKFGATAWPRAVILLIFLAALGNLYYHWKFGDEISAGAIGGAAKSEDLPSSGMDDDAQESPYAYYFRVGAILLLPIIFAFLLEPIGFYTLTPFFIAAVIYLMGERRWAWILGVSVVTYVVILLLFAKLFYTGLPVGTVHPFYDFSNWLLAFLQSNWLGQ